MDFKLYTRTSGVVCYSAQLLDAGSKDKTVTALLSTRLASYWLSVWRIMSESSTDRTLTRLTPESRALFLADAQDRDADGYGRAIAVVGWEAGDEASLADPTALRSSLHAFAARETGPIRFVMLQGGDSSEEHLFVPHQPDARVHELLQAFGLDPAKPALQSLPYERLASETLERLTDQVCRYAFPATRPDAS
jgi:hypothetical protein